MKQKIKFSIITATYNNVYNLRKTLDSILSQTYKNYECIVIDGGSQDGTIELLREYEGKFEKKMRWYSERDKGIYDAVNKGILKAKGDVIGMMYDKFANIHCLAVIAKTMIEKPVDGVYGDLLYIGENNAVIRKWKMGRGTIKGGWMAAHPTLYLKREVYDKWGLYDISYKNGADYEFEIRILKNGRVSLEYIPRVLVHMFYGGMSTGGLRAYLRSFFESVDALRKNNVGPAVFISMLRTLRVIFQFMAR